MTSCNLSVVSTQNCIYLREFNHHSRLLKLTFFPVQDDKARLAMCESQAWLPVASLFGLLGCPVPHRLKAQILLTLAAFAKSPEIAYSLWHTLEQSQAS